MLHEKGGFRHHQESRNVPLLLNRHLFVACMRAEHMGSVSGQEAGLTIVDISIDRVAYLVLKA